jgi:hypothetical protein
MIKVSQDPGYLAEAGSLKLDVSPIDGGAILNLIGRLAKSPPAILDRMRALQSGQITP